MLINISYHPPDLLPCMMLLFILVIFTVLVPVVFIPVLSLEAFSTYTEAEEKADDSNTAEDTKRQCFALGFNVRGEGEETAR